MSWPNDLSYVFDSIPQLSSIAIHKPSQDLTDISAKRGPAKKKPSGFLPAELNGRKKHKTVSYPLILSGAYWGISILMSSNVFKNRLLSADKFSQRTQQVQ